jgi:hypothetical protein
MWMLTLNYTTCNLKFKVFYGYPTPNPQKLVEKIII